jgi:hypothetical protein
MPVPIAGEMTIADLLSLQAGKHPDDVYAIFPDRPCRDRDAELR